MRNLKSIDMGANSILNLIRFQPLAYQRLVVPSLQLKLSSINQNPSVNVELSSFFNVKGAFFMVHILEYVVDVDVYCSHSVETFFCSRRGEFIVITRCMVRDSMPQRLL